MSSATALGFAEEGMQKWMTGGFSSGRTGVGARRRYVRFVSMKIVKMDLSYRVWRDDALSRCVPFRMVPTRLARRVDRRGTKGDEGIRLCRPRETNGPTRISEVSGPRGVNPLETLSIRSYQMRGLR